MAPSGEEEVAAELEQLEGHHDGDAEVEAERAAQAGEKRFGLKSTQKLITSPYIENVCC